jgi:Fe-S cluster assembly protein SufD
MAVTASEPTTAADLVGGFTPEVFARHIAGLFGAPAWWLERKRTAYARFEALPMPSRTDEGWRFSNIAGVTLGGYAPAAAEAKAKGVAHADLSIESAATLSFLNGRPDGAVAISAAVSATGVVVSTLSEAVRRHPELLREHFMAQPQKLGSAKFAALHEAFVEDGAFIFVPKGVVVEKPILVVHAALGAGSAVFPHTLVIAEDNARVVVVDYFISDDNSRQFACGANDLYAGHGAKISYAAAQCWSLETLSLQFNSTVVRASSRSTCTSAAARLAMSR